MKHIFLDTNIIIDIFAARTPHDIAAIELYRFAKDNKIKIYISAESQFISAKSNSKINLIVTRDKKGFKKSDIAIADANQAIQYILAS